jgi:hypothetical protein
VEAVPAVLVRNPVLLRAQIRRMEWLTLARFWLLELLVGSRAGELARLTDCFTGCNLVSKSLVKIIDSRTQTLGHGVKLQRGKEEFRVVPQRTDQDAKTETGN